MTTVRTSNQTTAFRSLLTPESFMDMCIVDANFFGQQDPLMVSNDWLIHVIQTIESELRSFYRLLYLRLRFGSVGSLSPTAAFFQHQVLSDIFVNQNIDLSIDYYDDSVPFALRATSVPDDLLLCQRYKLHLPLFWRKYISKLFISSEACHFNTSEKRTSETNDFPSPTFASTPTLTFDRINRHLDTLDAMLLVRKNGSTDYEIIKLDEHEKAGFQPILSVEACPCKSIQE